MDECDAFRGRLTVYTANQWDLVAGLTSILCPVIILTKYTQEVPPRPGFGLFEIACCKAEIMENEGQGLDTMQGVMIGS